jgi:hypothetical protein
MYHTNDHDRRQAEQERRHRIEQRASQYHVPHDLAAIMSDDVLRLAEDYAQRTSLVSPRGLGSAAASPYAIRRYREQMIVGLKHITETRCAGEEDRASWRAFWTKWDAKHAPPTRAERERSRREHDRSEAQQKQRHESEMRDARDAFLEDMP